MRTVICHYHIFKNSGTSFDEQLTANYGDAHCTFDGPFRYSKINQDELFKIINNHKHCVAFSSHQINLPVPTSLDFCVEPVVFVRHPLLRIRSIYQFGKKSPSSSPVGDLSLNLDFADWVHECMKTPTSVAAISNAQARLLSSVYNRLGIQRRSPEGGMLCDLNQALRNLSQVNLVGRTEYFESDVGRFTEILARSGIDFSFHRKSATNVTSRDIALPLDARLDNVREEVGDETYDLLESINEQDLYLFNHVSERVQ